MVKKSPIYIQFYNSDSVNLAEYGPFSTIVCDGTQVTGVAMDESEDETIAAYDKDLESYRIYNKPYPSFHCSYFVIVARST